MTTDCHDCPLRRMDTFEPMSDSELAFMRNFKSGELTVDPNTTVLLQGSTSPQIFTVLVGWGIRYTLLPDGGRQVINFVMPGDLIGLQAGLLGEMKHSFESVTRMTLCVFARADLWELFKTMPHRAYDMTWLAAREEHFLGDLLATVSRRTGRQRVAWGLLTYFRRASRLGFAVDGTVPLPFTQQHLADAFGLSLVHTNKVLRSLREAGLADTADGKLHIADADGLEETAMIDAPSGARRPLI